MSSAIVLFGHGARDPEWARPFEAIRRILQGDTPDVPVVLAFLESMAPTLEQAIDQLARDGAVDITVMPLFMAQGGHLKRDLPLAVLGAIERNPGINLRVGPAIGDSPVMLRAIADWVREEHRYTLLGDGGDSALA